MISQPDFAATGAGTCTIEMLAGFWGIQKQGGSKAAGRAAVLGGLLGMFLGSLIPIPIFGNLLGMLMGSFGLAFLAEHHKMKQADHAARVASGAVLARLAMIFIKIGITLLMILSLGAGIALSQ